jgi:hypothetical protein
MLTVSLIAVVILFVIPGLLLLIAKLLRTNAPHRPSRLIGFPLDPAPPGPTDPPT